MKVLFVGAIRRNGYATAKALRTYGLDCDILLPQNQIDGVFYEYQRDDIPEWVNIVDYVPSNIFHKLFKRIKYNFDFYKYDLIHSRCLGALSYIKIGIPYVEQSVGSDMREAAIGSDLLAKRIVHHYRKAKRLIISQPDHLDICEKLGLENHTYVPLLADTENYFPDEERYHFEAYDLTVLHPTHLDWTYSYVDRSPLKGNDKNYRSSTKGNDRLIRAFGKLVKSGCNGLLIIAKRGIDIHETRELIDNIGIRKNVLWIDELDNTGLRRYFSSVDLVADQFDCGSLGLIAYDAMLCGSVVMGYLNEECTARCYNEVPPIINCRTEEDIYDKLLAISKPKLEEDGAKSRDWVLKNHAPERVARLLKDIYSS